VRKAFRVFKVRQERRERPARKVFREPLAQAHKEPQALKELRVLKEHKDSPVPERKEPQVLRERLEQARKVLPALRVFKALRAQELKEQLVHRELLVRKVFRV
jgi:hypothetical protein